MSLMNLLHTANANEQDEAWSIGESVAYRFSAQGVDSNDPSESTNITFVDDSANASPVLPFGEAHVCSVTPFGDGYSAVFDGSTQYARISNTPANIELNGSFTLELYFRLNAALVYKDNTGKFFARLLSGTAANSMELTLSGTTGTPDNITFGQLGGSQIATSGQVVTLARWHHIGISRATDGEVAVFFNGSKIFSGQANTTALAGSPLFVGGANVTGKIGYTPAYISNIRLVKDRTVYDPAASSITVPNRKLTLLPDTTVFALVENNFNNMQYVPGEVVLTGVPQIRPLSPFPSKTYRGGSAAFDGAGDYLKIADNVGLSPESSDFCMELFFYAKTITPISSIFSKIEGAYPAGFEWYLGIHTASKLTFSCILTGGASLVLIDPTVVIPNTWYHVAVVRKNSTIAMYVNGVKVATAAIALAIRRTTASVTVGKDLESAVNRPLNGFVSNARFVKGSYVYDPDTSSIDVPKGNLAVISGTELLLRLNTAGIVENRGLASVRVTGTAKASTTVMRLNKPTIYTGASGGLIGYPIIFGGYGTVEFWFYLDTADAGGRFVDVGRYGSGWQTSQAIVAVNSSSVRYLAANGDSSWYYDTTANVSIPIKTWHHFKYSAGRVWINGILRINSAGSPYVGPTYYLIGATKNTYFDDIVS